MAIQLYNTLTRKKEPFTPLKEGHLSLYVCGVTVYDHCHIGHARAYVVFDIWRRLFEEKGYNVTYIQNFTDIDDKIITRANEQNIPIQELTETFIKAYYDDMDALSIKRATSYPKATEYISQMQDLIQQLIANGAAYELEGSVYFSVESKEDYGKLSQKILEDLMAGARVDVDVIKKNPLDFVLWKPSKEGEPSWESPWGPGRPGWHIECSAMAMNGLGETIDIHGGGSDLIFPHHENEIAQSECASGKPFAKYWLHNGFVTIKDEKMSKSKKNFFTVRDVLKEVPPAVLRFFLLRVHYRAPLNFSEETLNDARKAYNRLAETVRNVPPNSTEIPSDSLPHFDALEDAFMDALMDDLNMSEALAQLFEMSKTINKLKVGSERLLKLTDIIGLDLVSDSTEPATPKEVLALVEARQSAKEAKDYAEADRIRDQILELGYSLKDTPNGPIVATF